MNPKTYKKIMDAEIDVLRKDLNNLFLEVENDDERKQEGPVNKNAGTVTGVEGVLNILNRIVNM